jgi:hypothetical protein
MLLGTEILALWDRRSDMSFSKSGDILRASDAFLFGLLPALPCSGLKVLSLGVDETYEESSKNGGTEAKTHREGVESSGYLYIRSLVSYHRDRETSIFY